MMLDETDKKILHLLQDNARISNAEIARQVELAPSAVLKRIRTLETEGVIMGYETRLNPAKLDLGMTSLVEIDTDEKPGSLNIGKKISDLPEVQEISFFAGDSFYLAKVRTRDPESHSELIRKMGELGATQTRTILLLKTIKDTLKLDF
ncbi:Lrp/AsnC family transcriptional regulator [Lentisphaerota bacterium ZTH]|nr:Lrp/AsnC family transcriptional regulator [Lentisphaerota bacterium]WET05948.1 Lrp/AsnC family transcriptional regulator [Lentisphaerota bacterium ZTH]